MPDVAECLLCNEPKELQVSHVIPAFVWRWLRETAPTFIRGAENPNVRVQDGPKRRLLCFDCEQLIGKDEGRFADEIFRPLHVDQDSGTLCYRRFALRFAASVSLRVLAVYEAKDGLARLSEEQRVLARQAKETWRSFLLSRAPHPGRFEQHLIPFFGVVQASDQDIAPNLNRYLLRALALDLIRAPGFAATYAKLGRIVVFGFIENVRQGEWRNTKLHVNKGCIGAHCVVLPDAFRRYLNAKAAALASQMKLISTAQRAKIAEAYAKAPGCLDASPLAEAMRLDFELSGDAAIDCTDDDSSAPDSAGRAGGEATRDGQLKLP